MRSGRAARLCITGSLSESLSVDRMRKLGAGAAGIINREKAGGGSSFTGFFDLIALSGGKCTRFNKASNRLFTIFSLNIQD